MPKKSDGFSKSSPSKKELESLNVTVSPAFLGDARAKQEDERWEKIRDVKHFNNVLWHRATGGIVFGFMVTVAVIIISTASVWFWHYLTPWVWLESDQLEKLRAVIFNGSLGAVFSIMIQRFFKE